MPTWFKAYLEGLPYDLASELMIWLDGEPDAVRDIIATIVNEEKRRKEQGLIG